ncbi:MAG: hypothetical protein RSA24_04005, partial [Clostridia bacterium]
QWRKQNFFLRRCANPWGSVFEKRNPKLIGCVRFLNDKYLYKSASKEVFTYPSKHKVPLNSAVFPFFR